MESVPCNLCRSQDASLIMVGSDRGLWGRGLEGTFRVVRCTRCSLVYLDPRPDAKELNAYYSSPGYQIPIRDYPQRQRGPAKLGQKIWLRRRTPSFVPRGRVLDIGCSGGAYLLALRNLGWEVYGVELAPDSAEYAREQLGLDVRIGAAEVELAEFSEDYFDVVTLWHVLEHFFDPSWVLGEVHRILKPGGRLMLEVPNFQSLSRFILRSYWSFLDIPRHLYHFTPQTLEAMLTKAGFRVANVKGVPAAVAITASLQLLWNRWTGELGARKGIVVNPVFLCLCFPASWLLARLGVSAAMTAEATKPSPVQSA